jgi:hypothetical protein
MRRRSNDYYAFVALHRLFLISCGADLETHKGGDVKKASRILHVGAAIARGWQRDHVSYHGIKLPDDTGPVQPLTQGRAQQEVTDASPASGANAFRRSFKKE